MPRAQVASCWHFHLFNHRLLEMLWEIPAGWRSCSVRVGRVISKPRHRGLSVTHLRVRWPQVRACLREKMGRFEVLCSVKIWSRYPGAQGCGDSGRDAAASQPGVEGGSPPAPPRDAPGPPTAAAAPAPCSGVKQTQERSAPLSLCGAVGRERQGRPGARIGGVCAECGVLQPRGPGRGIRAGIGGGGSPAAWWAFPCNCHRGVPCTQPPSDLYLSFGSLWKPRLTPFTHPPERGGPHSQGEKLCLGPQAPVPTTREGQVCVPSRSGC